MALAPAAVPAVRAVDLGEKVTQSETTLMRHFEVLEGVQDAVFIDGGGDVVGVLFELGGGVTHCYAYAGLQNH